MHRPHVLPDTAAGHAPRVLARSLARRLAGVLLLLAIVLLAVLRSHAGTRLDGFTVDEAWHIVAGTQYVRSGDFRLNPEHPPLVKLWVGAFMPDAFEVPPPGRLSEKAAERDLVERITFLQNDPVAAQQRARIAMWALNGVLLLALGLLLWRALGLAWAAGTLLVLALDPTVAAHLPVAMTDLPLALTLGLAMVACGLLAAMWQWRWALAAGAAIGLALAAKHSALAGLAGLVLSMLFAAAWNAHRVGARTLGRRLLQLLAAGFIGIVVLWAMYGLRFHAGADGSDAFNRPIAEKIADLNIPHWRTGIAAADDWRLLPRAYLWGLADTVRAGVEGRGQSMFMVWGAWHRGEAPWFLWPSVLLSKLPLAAVALVALGLALLAVPRLRRCALPPVVRWTLATVSVASLAHFAALMDAQGSYGGVRHAMPVVLALAVLAGAVAAFAIARRSRALAGAAVVLLCAHLAMTIPEPRVWEYHNELAGGSREAYRYFSNEGLDLGQRFPEIREFYAREIAPGGEPMYSAYWFGEEQARGAGLRYRRRVESLDDTNVEGIYEGFFVYPMSSTLPAEHFGWDPQEAFAELTLVERMGYVGIWHGRQRMPMVRAHSLYEKVVEYLYQENGKDMRLVAARLEEVLPHVPHHLGAAIELGNAYLKLGDRSAALRAYGGVLEQQRMPVEPLVRSQLQAQIATVGSVAELAAVAPLRNPWME